MKTTKVKCECCGKDFLEEELDGQNFKHHYCENCMYNSLYDDDVFDFCNICHSTIKSGERFFQDIEDEPFSGFICEKCYNERRNKNDN